MEQFDENTKTDITIQVVRGTILEKNNTHSGGHDLFYWANFVPHFSNKKIKIVGECGFDIEREKTEFVFDYYPQIDTVKIVQNYRMSMCDTDIFDKFSRIVMYGENKNTSAMVLPWIRFPRTKDGVLVPILIETLLGKMPRHIIFY
jgi:hypothetical protein